MHQNYSNVVIYDLGDITKIVLATSQIWKNTYLKLINQLKVKAFNLHDKLRKILS